MTTARDLVVEIDRLLDAPPDVVFRAITDPDLLPRWMGPSGSTCSVDELELALGGRVALTIALPDGGPTIGLYGFYEHVEPPRRLVHSWAMTGEDVRSTVVWDLEPVGQRTRLRLTHLGLTLPEDVAQNDAGWRHLLDRLADLVAT